MAKCKACGNGLGFSLIKYTVPDISGRNFQVCKNCVDAAAKAGKRLQYNPQLDQVVMVGKEETEIRKKCKVCGHILCFTALDLYNNQQNAKNARLNAMTSAANALNGQLAASAVNQANAQGHLNQIVDYNKCPHCGSVDLIELSKSEYELELKKANEVPNTVSTADELKKYKELLDMGVITQEEFDAKKKQLLGL